VKAYERRAPEYDDWWFRTGLHADRDRPGRHEELFTGHFYGHLEEAERQRFLAEARPVADELVVGGSALRREHEPVEVQERVLEDGSRWEVYKRYFTAGGLAQELGGGRLVHAGRCFVAVRA
jgi:hypothetical protein